MGWNGLSKVKIVTDSTADIPRELREFWGIGMVPLKVHFGAETFEDGVTIGSEQFFDRLAKAETLPTTSQPSPADFLEIYKSLMTETDTELISIHLSSAFSGTYQSALLAKSMLEDPSRVTVIDSKSASYGIGLLAVAAAEAARQGKSAAECVEVIQRFRRETHVYFLVGSLEYLQKGGRIGKAAAVLGSLLNIKPILTIDGDGTVSPADKVRGHKKAMARIVDLLREKKGDRKVQFAVAHSNSPGLAEEMAALLREQLGADQVIYTTLGAVIGTHVGPGTVAAFIYPE
jgi:DegV family protein with EDD domain